MPQASAARMNFIRVCKKNAAIPSAASCSDYLKSGYLKKQEHHSRIA